MSVISIALYTYVYAYKNWKKSICHENSSVRILLGAHLASADVASVKSGSASPRQLSPARLMEHDKIF